jgi:hypothetical protein
MPPAQFRDRPPTEFPHFRPQGGRVTRNANANTRTGQRAGSGKYHTRGVLEDWQSGRLHRLGKAADPQGSQGFESLIFRHPVDADFRSTAVLLAFRAQRLSPIDDLAHEDRCHCPTDDGCHACGAWARPTTCGCGVIGSRAGLRYQWSKGRGGSSPLIRTIFAYISDYYMPL